MTMTNKAARSYLSRVRRCIPRGQERTRQMVTAAELAESYCSENPNAQGPDLEAAFGSPASFAATMVGEQGVAQAKRQRNRLGLAAIAVVLVALIAVAALFFARWYRLQKYIPENGDFDVIYPAVTLSPEEFEKIRNDPNMHWVYSDEGD